jgi:hypothetical protein
MSNRWSAQQELHAFHFLSGGAFAGPPAAFTSGLGWAQRWGGPIEEIRSGGVASFRLERSTGWGGEAERIFQRESERHSGMNPNTIRA